MNEGLIPLYEDLLRDVTRFSAVGSGIRLRAYQVQVARAIIDSVIFGKGLSFVVIFPRQSGKNELQAQIEVYLLSVCSVEAVEMVKVSPTWKPQSLNAMRRLERVLKHNLISCGRWVKRSGYIYQFGEAMFHFLSGAPTSSIVGATASLLLECDEAQDVTISKWDKEIAPMAASTNATRVFWGTAWTSKTLLARELRVARSAEAQDGIRRTWVITAEEVGSEVPAYRAFVDEQVSRLGRNNPLVRTQFFSEEIDCEGGMFPLSRRMLMLGSHDLQAEPVTGAAYVFTIDVAGQDEAAIDVGSGLRLDLQNPARDSTVLTIFRVDITSLTDPLVGKPTYRVVNRITWQGVRHSNLYGTIINLAELWSPFRVIIDATGVGAGLANFLHDRLGSRLIPFEFTQASKSDLGWSFLSIIETGRYKEPGIVDSVLSQQLEYCQYSILDGPGKIMRWGVPDGTRDHGTGELIHDDYILSAALVSLLDKESWGLGKSLILHQKDILDEMKF
jgi:hypothetical protein